MAGRSDSSRGRLTQFSIGLVLAAVAVVGLFPFLFMVVASLKSQGQYAASSWRPSLPLHLANYTVAWEQIRPYAVTTAVVAIGSVLGALALCTVAAFVLARYDFPLRGVIHGAIAVFLMVPGVASLIPSFLLMRDLGLLNTRWVLMVPHIVGGAVLGTLLLTTFVRQLPQELFDAARVDGASGPRMFWSIMLPLSWPVIATVGLVTVIGVWNDFFWPLLTVTQDDLRTMSVGLEFFKGQNGTAYGPLFAGYALASAPLLLLFVALSRYVLDGLTGGLASERS